MNDWHNWSTWRQQWTQAPIMGQMGWLRPEEECVGDWVTWPQPQWIPWTQASSSSMMTTWQQWLPSSSLREEYIGEEECVSEAEFCEIDITGKMESLSSKGLTEVEAATLAAPGLRLQLTNIKHTLDHLIQHCTNVTSGALHEHPEATTVSGAPHRRCRRSTICFARSRSKHRRWRRWPWSP